MSDSTLNSPKTDQKNQVKLSDVSMFSTQKCTVLGCHHCQAIPINLPDLQDKDKTSFLQYKIRSLYPGDSSDIVFDAAANGTGQGDHILYILPKAGNDELKPVDHAVIHIVQIIQESRNHFSPNSDHLILLQASENWEVIELEQGSVTKAGSYDDYQGAFDFLFHRIEESDKTYKISLVTDQDKIYRQPDLILPEQLAAQVQALHLKDLLNNKILSGLSRAPLFRPRRQINYKSRFIRLTLSAVIIAMAIFVINAERALSLQKRDLEENLRLFNQYQRRVQKAENLYSEYSALKEEYQLLTDGWTPTVYRLLSNLTDVIGNDAKITSLTYKNGRFVIECRGRNPLALIERMENTGVFTSMSHSMIIPEAGTSLEQFQIEGVFHDL